MQKVDLKNKTVVVTGAAKGIGKAIALEFAKVGANIVLNYRSSVSEETVAEITGYGVTCLPVQGDVSRFAEAEQVIAAAKEQFGSVDVLVNNAGITKDMLLMRMTEEAFDAVIAVNLKGAFNMIRHASKLMLKQKSGTILNLSSVVGETGNAGQANYAASKAGIIGLTKSTAMELASRGITCNAIAPGFIETDMTKNITEDNALRQSIPMGRMGKPEDVANVIAFLASDAAGYITGEVIRVDGGLAM